jgi:hypothetical protein
MSISLALRIVLAIAGVGALGPICAAAHDVASQIAQQAEVVMEVAAPPASSFFAKRYPFVPPKRNAAWTCIERIRRTHQECSGAQGVFTGGLHPGAIPQVLNFGPASYVGTFSSESAVACIRRRGPPSFSLA